MISCRRNNVIENLLQWNTIRRSTIRSRNGIHAVGSWRGDRRIGLGWPDKVLRENVRVGEAIRTARFQDCDEVGVSELVRDRRPVFREEERSKKINLDGPNTCQFQMEGKRWDVHDLHLSSPLCNGSSVNPILCNFRASFGPGSASSQETYMGMNRLTSMVEVKSWRMSGPVALPWIILAGRHLAVPAWAHAFAKAVNVSSLSAARR